MMKKSTIHKIIILIFTISIVIVNPTSAVANQETKEITTLNQKNTAIKNKYGITGEILKINKEYNSSLVLTMDGIYYIRNGVAKKYSIEGSILNTTTFYKSSQEVYISPIQQTDSKGNNIYVEIKLNLIDGSTKVTTNYSEYIKKLKWGQNFNRISTFTDSYHNKWFTLFYNYSEKYYYLYRIDTLGNV